MTTVSMSRDEKLHEERVLKVALYMHDYLESGGTGKIHQKKEQINSLAQVCT